MILVGVLEDQPLMAEAMTAALNEPELEVRFTAASCGGVLDVVEGHPVDVLILDLPPLEADRVQVMQMVESLQPPQGFMPVLILSRELSAETARLALTRGVVDVLTTTALGKSELVASVHAAARGEKRLAVDVIAEQGGLRAAPPVYHREVLNVLTPREHEILRLVGTGGDNLKIAAALGITERTVKAHVSALYRKLLVENRVELALVALRLGAGRAVQLQSEG